VKWRLINSGNLDGYTNMAIDEAMFNLRGVNRGTPPTLRMYGWNPPAISIGYFQSPLPSLLRGVGGIDVVRRLTGGGAILHDEELTFCLVADLKDSIIPEDVSASYDMISLAVISGLQALGIAARMRGKESAETALAASGGKPACRQEQAFFCFSRPSKYDIVFEGRKLVGSAQRRKHGILLHHGSILLGEQNLDGSTSANSILGRKVEPEELGRYVADGFEKEFSTILIPGELTQQELKLSRQLAMNKRGEDR
jgi:lipoate-protein ligase A